MAFLIKAKSNRIINSNKLPKGMDQISHALSDNFSKLPPPCNTYHATTA